MAPRKINFDNFRSNILIYILVGLFIIGLLYFGFGNKDLMGITGKTHLSCTNRCPGAGATECTLDGQIKYCGDYDLDPCLEWNVRSCYGEKRCSGGQCVSSVSSCTDSDSSELGYQPGELRVAGHVTSSGGTIIDRCASSTSITERYCSSPTQTATTTQDCGAGYGCKLSSSNEAYCAQSSVPTCTDSDNGQNLDVKGYAQQTGEDKRWDSCLNGQVREYYCIAGADASDLFNCPTGQTCGGGKCVISACSSHSYVKCYNNRLYWHNSCDSREEIYNSQLNCRN